MKRTLLSALGLTLVVALLLVGREQGSVVLAKGFVQTAVPAQATQIQIIRNTNIRSEPSTKSAILTTAHPDQRFLVTGKSADGAWWQIDFNSQPAWIYAPLVQVVSPTDSLVPSEELGSPPTTAPIDGAAVVTAKVANVRAGPGIVYPVIGATLAGDRFAVTGKSEDGFWWRVDFHGEEGWLIASLVQAANTANVAVVELPAGESIPVPLTEFDPQLIRFRLEPIFSGLGQPTQVTNAGDGSGRFFVVERAGRVRVFPGPNSEGQTFLDIEDRVGDSGPEQGLFSIAFPPNYATTGYFFVNYTNTLGNTVIARYHVSADPNRADPASESEVLFLDQPAPNQNGGLLLFGPDGYLWVGMGDGGGANDTFHNGQNPDTLLGKMLRLDVTSDLALPYRIPPDNPWVTADWNGTEMRDEVWALGLRNPWRYSFDRRTGDLWIADVGESQSEEIDFVPAAQLRQGGLNFGWPKMEGPYCLSSSCATAGLVLPITEYGHAGNGCAITGGYVYRGQAYPFLDGVYFFADYCSGNVWAYWGAGKDAQTALILSKAAVISSFGEDEAGELYLTDIGGGVVYRLVAGYAMP